MIESLNRVKVSAKALQNNIAVCRKYAGDVPVLAMVKADAYGHGMLDCARIFIQGGAAALGVAEVVEGVTLREAGCTAPVYILAGIVPQTARAAVEYDLTPVVPDGWSLQALNEAAMQAGRRVGVHLKIDAGMGRQGTLPEHLRKRVVEINSFSHLEFKGIVAHFPMADERNSGNSALVRETFSAAVAELRSQLDSNFCSQLSNSAGLMYVDEAGFDMVRPGIALYGYYPDGKEGSAGAEEPKLIPAMSFTSTIIQIRELGEGVGLGYGHTYTTARPSQIAILPVGYEDGYLRRYSNMAEVLIGGMRAPVVGRISMNLTMVDVTDIDGVQVGDEAVLLGQQGEEVITADELAQWMDTISYEVLCLFGHMNNRVLVD